MLWRLSTRKVVGKDPRPRLLYAISPESGSFILACDMQQTHEGPQYFLDAPNSLYAKCLGSVKRGRSEGKGKGKAGAVGKLSCDTTTL